MEFQSLSCDHINPHQVAIALENAAESNLIGLKPTVDSTVPRHIGAGILNGNLRLPTSILSCF